MHLGDVLRDGEFVYARNENPVITGIAPAQIAEIDEIAIAYHIFDIKQTPARVVLTQSASEWKDKLLIVPIKSVGEAAEILVRRFIKLGIYEDYSLPVSYTTDENMNRYGEDCDIAKSAYIAGFTSIGNHVCIGENCVIGENVTIGSDVVIGENVIIKPGARIGTTPFYHFGKECFSDFAGIGSVIIGDNVTIGANTIVQRGSFSNTLIGNDVAIGDMVVIGHDVVIGNHCLIVTQTGISGGAILDDYVQIYGQCGINERVHLGKNVKIMAKSAVWKDIPAGKVISGSFGREHKEELRLRARLKKI